MDLVSIKDTVFKENCGICFESLEGKKDNIGHVAGHSFHLFDKNCLAKWQETISKIDLDRPLTCPSCRAVLIDRSGLLGQKNVSFYDKRDVRDCVGLTMSVAFFIFLVMTMPPGPKITGSSLELRDCARVWLHVIPVFGFMIFSENIICHLNIDQKTQITLFSLALATSTLGIGLPLINNGWS